MKYIYRYFIATSVIFHCGILVALYFLWPFYTHATEVAKSLVDSYEDKVLVTILEESEIRQDDLVYWGYSVKYEDKILYVPGYGEKLKIGSQARLFISEHLRKGVSYLAVFVVEE